VCALYTEVHSNLSVLPHRLLLLDYSSSSGVIFED